MHKKYKKTKGKNIWHEEYEVLNETSKQKFRSKNDVNQYLFQYWQYCEGNFIPTKNLKKSVRIFDNIDYACNLIKKRKYKMLCLNDSEGCENFETAKQKIIDSFEKILPEKSSFEK